MRFRFRLRQHLGVPVTIEPAGRAEDWLQGQGDLLIAGMGGRVPLAVQIGVLAHADLNRLADLGRHSQLGSVRKAWGTEMARLAGDIAGYAATPERLAVLQRDLLVPLELEALAGRAEFSTRSGAVSYLRSRLPLSGAAALPGAPTGAKTGNALPRAGGPAAPQGPRRKHTTG
jgi:hypothetical protein